jgi:hypothetical protein
MPRESVLLDSPKERRRGSPDSKQTPVTIFDMPKRYDTDSPMI